MQVLVLYSDLSVLAIVDSFESLIWNDRYFEPGDFELYKRVTLENLELLQKDRFLYMRDSDRLMIVESRKIDFDAERGNSLVVAGRSAESILDRRIIWNQTTLTGNFQDGIQQLLNENAISPTDTNRTIPNLIFEASTDVAITELTIDAQFIRTNLLTAIQNLCTEQGIGFKITLSSDETKLVFKLYAGADRSYNQLANPYVVFSPRFDNVISSDYSESSKTMKNVTLVTGEGEESVKKMTTVGSGTGLSRREMTTDASGISQTVNDILIPDAEYLLQLAQKGYEELAENVMNQTFSGKMDTTKMFKIGVDFNLGDIVQISSDYGIDQMARITEILRNETTSGLTVYPTFKMLTDEE